jgi:hypothetical protein
MKLYEIPRESKIYETVSDGSEYLIFYKLDGAYSFCVSEKGGVCHISARTELEPFEDGYKLSLTPASQDKD